MRRFRASANCLRFTLAVAYALVGLGASAGACEDSHAPRAAETAPCACCLTHDGAPPRALAPVGASTQAAPGPVIPCSCQAQDSALLGDRANRTVAPSVGTVFPGPGHFAASPPAPPVNPTAADFANAHRASSPLRAIKSVRLRF